MKMNFKIESSFIDITNYPIVEKHFEEMAAKGWLINKIIVGNIFIYKKIIPEALEFSISPYEVETEFTKKTKDEIAEFQSVCESVGWNYATKSYDLHIYFKEKGSDALDIQTDEEEEFRTIEKIGKKYIRGLYIQIPIFLFLSWITLSGLFTNIQSMRDGLQQIGGPMILITVIMQILQLFNIKIFLKKNRENIELGKDIEFSKSKFNYFRFAFTMTFVFLLIFITYILYGGLVLNNKFLLIAILPSTIGIIIAFIYRMGVKPSKLSLKTKKIGFLVTIILSIMISTLIFGNLFGNIDSVFNDNPDINKLKILLVSDFNQGEVNETGNLLRQTSLLVPKSYDYYSHSREIYESVRTEYSEALTENLAKNLIERYIRQAEIGLEGRYGREIEIYFNEDIYDEYLFEKAGITLEEFNSLKGGDIKKSIKDVENKIRERSITKDMENLWNVEEVYFLNYDKTEIVIRQGKEVFNLEGYDFSDPDIIKIVKGRLGLI